MKIGVCVSHELPKFKLKYNKKDYIEHISSDWSKKFIDTLSEKNLGFGVVYIDRNDWIDQVNKYDILVWKPNFMGIQSSQFFKEKIYFIQFIMNKRIYPNYETVWHFDSKVAQKYLFQYQKINTPNTFASFCYNECIDYSNNLEYPIIIKSSNGAGSKGVRQIKTKVKLKKEIFFKFIGVRIMNKIFRTQKDPFGYLYLQEFIKDNDGDLRINIIGDKYAVGFWRLNRKNDFRASGSGKIDYEKEIPEYVIKYCAEINKKNNFDSMAYDILFKEDKFLIVEMSYGYVDTAIYNSKGYYILDKNGNIECFKKGNYWPQQLWIDWIIYNSINSVE